MNKLSKVLFCGSALALALGALPAWADNDGFDFDSQRGEVKTVNPVPGKKVDHHGIVINPTPQSIEHPYTGVLNASGGFNVKDKQKAFAGDL